MNTGTERATLILAPNASLMTLDGTNTWLLHEPGGRRAAVIDPARWTRATSPPSARPSRRPTSRSSRSC